MKHWGRWLLFEQLLFFPKHVTLSEKMRFAWLVSIPLTLLTSSEVLSRAQQADMSLDMLEKCQLRPVRIPSSRLPCPRICPWLQQLESRIHVGVWVKSVNDIKSKKFGKSFECTKSARLFSSSETLRSAVLSHGSDCLLGTVVSIDTQAFSSGDVPTPVSKNLSTTSTGWELYEWVKSVKEIRRRKFAQGFEFTKTAVLSHRSGCFCWGQLAVTSEVKRNAEDAAVCPMVQGWMGWTRSFSIIEIC